MDYDDALDISAKQILLFAKYNFLLWIISAFFVFISRSISNSFIDIITLLLLALILIKSIKLSVLINKHFNIISEMYWPHPKERRNSIIVSFINIVILGLVIFLFIRGNSNRYTIPLILVSCFIFAILGASLGRENKAGTG